MADPISVNDKNFQKKILSETIAGAKKYCNPDVIKKADPDSINIKFVDTAQMNGAKCEHFQRKDGGHDIKCSDDFPFFSKQERIGIFCHEFTHASKGKNNSFRFNSREEEREAFFNGLDAEVKFSNDIENDSISMTAMEKTKRKIMIENSLKEFPDYSCLPEKSVTNQKDYDKAVSEFDACIDRLEKNK